MTKASTSSDVYLHHFGGLLETGLVWCDVPFSFFGIFWSSGNSVRALSGDI
jgi:hypothetical protein